MDRMAKQLMGGFNNSFNNPRPQRQVRQPRQNFKQVDISKTINFKTSVNSPNKGGKKRK